MSVNKKRFAPGNEAEDAMDGEQRLDKLEHHATRTESRLEAIEGRQAEHGVVLQSHGSKLDQIFTAVTRHEAAPKFDWLRTLQAIALIVGMFVGVVGPASAFGVWFVTSLTAKDNEVQNVKISYMERFSEEREARIKALEKLVFTGYSAGTWKPKVE
jgi:hypothetical protein